MAPHEAHGPKFPRGIPVKKHVLKHPGRPSISVDLPQFYFDFSFIMAHFPAPTSRVRSLLPDKSLVPVEIVPGLAVVSLAAFEYRVMATLAPYNEVAVMVPVRHEPEFNIPLLPLFSPDDYDVAFWVHHLPVTTREARDVGLDVWNLPKVMADITFEDVGWMRHCKLREDGQDVLTLTAQMAETQLEARPFYALSIRNGQLLRSLVDTQAEYYSWFVPGRASFSLGNHPVARQLRSLRICNFAIAGLYAASARSRLHPGEVIPSLPPARAGRGRRPARAGTARRSSATRRRRP